MSPSEPSSGRDTGLRRSARSTPSSRRSCTGHRVREGWVDRHRLLDLSTGRPGARSRWSPRRPATGRRRWTPSGWRAGAPPAPPPGCPSTPRTTTPAGCGPTSPLALERAGCALAPRRRGFMAADSGDLIAGMLLPRLVNALAAGRRTSCSSSTTSTTCRSPPATSRSSSSSRTSPSRPTWSSSPAPTPASGWAGCAPRVCWPRSAPSELGFTADEAAALARRGAGPAVARRARRSSWSGPRAGRPALYLAALSLAGRADPDELVTQFQRRQPVRRRLPHRGGAQPALGARSASSSSRMSILDRFSAPLCDACGRHDGLGRDPRRPGAREPVPGPAGRRWALVPLPPPVRRRGPQRAGGPARRARAAAARARRPVAPGDTATSTRRSRTCAPPVAATRLPSWSRPTG